MKQIAFGIMLAGLVLASDIAFADNNLKKAAWVQGGAGIQYRIPYTNWRAVLLTAGYHTLRGVSGGIGFAF